MNIPQYVFDQLTTGILSSSYPNATRFITKLHNQDFEQYIIKHWLFGDSSFVLQMFVTEMPEQECFEINTTLKVMVDSKFDTVLKILVNSNEIPIHSQIVDRLGRIDRETIMDKVSVLVGSIRSLCPKDKVYWPMFKTGHFVLSPNEVRALGAIAENANPHRDIAVQYTPMNISARVMAGETGGIMTDISDYTNA